MEKQFFTEIEDKLKSVHRRENYISALEGLGNTLLVSSVSILGILFLLMLVPINSEIRTFLFYLLATFIPAVLLVKVILPLFRGWKNIGFSLNEYALRVGNHFPDIKDELANGLQLIESQGLTASPELINAAFKSIYVKSHTLNFHEILQPSTAKRNIVKGVFATVGLFVLMVFVPGISHSAFELWHYNIEFTTPPQFTIQVVPGNKSVTRGDDVFIKASVSGKDINYLSFFSKSIEETSFSEKSISTDSTGLFTVSEKAVKNSFDYYLSSGDVSSDKFHIEVINRPVIKNLAIRVIPPAYSGLPANEIEDNGNISLLKGSKVEWSVESSKPLINAKINFTKSGQLNLDISEKLATGSSKILSPDEYKIILNDIYSISNANPIAYGIKVLQDEFPYITVISPDADVKLGADNIIGFLIKIADDYGFNSLKLHYRLSSSRFSEVSPDFTTVNLPLDKSGLEREIDYVWDLAPLFLAEDDVVTYYFEVFDNDMVSGPKSAKTRTYTVRVPSLDELFATAEATQEKTTKSLEETLKEAEELNKELEQISNELKRDEQEITWEEKEKIENAVEKFQELEKKVDDINKQLSEMRKEMQQNDLLSRETMEKYMELQKLMEEITGDDLKKAFEKMQDMLQNMDRNQNQNAFEDMKQNEEFFKKSIERTINLLKRLQIEQKVDELTKRTEDLLEQQNQLSEETKESNSAEKNEELAKKQDEVTDKLDKLQEEMENLQEKMSEFEDMPKDQLEKMMEEFEKMQNQQLSEQAQQQMMQNKPNQAQENQQQISQNMQKMQEMMQMMQQQMAQMNQMQVFKDMMKAIENMVTLSKEQEKLKELSKVLSPSSPQFNENARKQSNLQNDLNKILDGLSELSQKTFAISPEMGKALGDAQREMSMALNSLHNRNGNMASRNQGQAMKSLNEAANLMSQAMQGMMNQQGNGSGMMTMMQQLQQMSQQQQRLNQMTQQLREQGQLTPQQMASLQRLAGEQQMLQKSLQELNKEARESGESKKLTTDLEKIARDMQEVISGMNTQKLDDELLLKQERILSKLLDAQRSINERDFEKQRESESGKEFVRETPPDILFSTEEGRDKLRDALLKAAKEGYSKDYEDLIRKYFEALQKEKGNN